MPKYLNVRDWFWKQLSREDESIYHTIYFSMLPLIPPKVFRYIGFGTQSDPYIQFIYVRLVLSSSRSYIH